MKDLVLNVRWEERGRYEMSTLVHQSMYVCTDRQTMHKTQVCTYTQVERSIGLCCLDEITLLEMQSDHLTCHPGQKCTTVHSLGRTSGPKTPSQDGLESACVHTSSPGRWQVNPSAFLRPNLTVLSLGHILI